MRSSIDPMIADIGSAYADLAPSTELYARRFKGPAGEWLLSRQTEALLRLSADFAGMTVLDVGGGHGQVARPLLSRGSAVCVHASTEEALGHLCEHSEPGLKTSTGSLTELPFPDRSFDLVTSFRILAHIGDWQAYLAELCRVARRAVIVDFPISGSVNALQPLLFGLKKRFEGDTRRYQAMSRIEVRNALTRVAFKSTCEIGQFVLPMVVHRKMSRPAVSSWMEHGLTRMGLDRSLGTPIILRAERLDTADTQKTAG